MEAFETDGEIFDRGDKTQCLVMSRSACERGRQLTGPALIADETSTIYVPQGWHCSHDEHDNLIIRKDA